MLNRERLTQANRQACLSAGEDLTSEALNYQPPQCLLAGAFTGEAPSCKQVRMVHPPTAGRPTRGQIAWEGPTEPPLTGVACTAARGSFSYVCMMRASACLHIYVYKTRPLAPGPMCAENCLTQVKPKQFFEYKLLFEKLAREWTILLMFKKWMSDKVDEEVESSYVAEVLLQMSTNTISTY